MPESSDCMKATVWDRVRQRKVLRVLRGEDAKYIYN